MKLLRSSVVVLAGLLAVDTAAGSAQTPPPPLLSATVADRTVTVSWIATGGDPQSFVLEVGSRSGVADITTLGFPGSQRSVVATAVPNGTYYLRLFAVVGGVRGPASNTVQASVGAAPCVNPPEPPRDLAASVNGQTLTLAWSAPFASAGDCPVSGYLLEAGSASGVTDIGTLSLPAALTFSTNVPREGTYFIRLRAWNAAGLSRASGEARVTIGASPGQLAWYGAPNVRYAPGGSLVIVTGLVANVGGQVLTEIQPRATLYARSCVPRMPGSTLPPNCQNYPAGDAVGQLSGQTYKGTTHDTVYHAALGPGDLGCVEVSFPAPSNGDPVADVQLNATGRGVDGVRKLGDLPVLGVAFSQDPRGNWVIRGRVRNSGTSMLDSADVMVVPMGGASGGALACRNARTARMWPGEEGAWEVNVGAFLHDPGGRGPSAFTVTGATTWTVSNGRE